MRAVIVGNGVAGIEAARTLRALRPDATITVVSEESEHFFSRTALMYALAGQLDRRALEPFPRTLYAELRLERVRARALGIEGRSLVLEGRAPLPFDALLIACGSRPRPAPWPGRELAGVGHFVTLSDLDWLEAELSGAGPRAAEARAGSPYARAKVAGGRALAPVVVGGGLIGIEVVEALLALRRRPRFVIRERWFWPVALDARESSFVAEALRAHGVDVELGAEVSRLVGDAEGRVCRAVIGEREVPCDLAVVAIGVEPNTAWLEGSGIALSAGGISVDAGLQSSIEGVFAAGDCASVPPDGRPEQLWYTARDQGRVAGRRLAGQDVKYARGVPYNSAKLMDIEYTTVGLVPPAHREREGLGELFHEERGPVRSTLRLVLEGERMVGFNALGRRYDHSVIARWIEEGRTAAYVREHLPRAAFDTELVPPRSW